MSKESCFKKPGASQKHETVQRQPYTKCLRKTPCEIAHCGKGSISILRDSFASVGKDLFWRGEWALGYTYMNF